LVAKYIGIGWNCCLLTIFSALNSALVICSHFVPQSKPEAALSFLSAWIHDEPFPEFDNSCFNE
jgi:hypothetical protein